MKMLRVHVDDKTATALQHIAKAQPCSVEECLLRMVRQELGLEELFLQAPGTPESRTKGDRP
jgi:hypothetical protein